MEINLVKIVKILTLIVLLVLFEFVIFIWLFAKLMSSLAGFSASVMFISTSSKQGQ